MQYNKILILRATKRRRGDRRKKMFEVICHLITGEIVNNIIYKIKLKIVKTPSDGKVHMLEGYASNMYEYAS